MRPISTRSIPDPMIMLFTKLQHFPPRAATFSIFGLPYAYILGTRRRLALQLKYTWVGCCSHPYMAPCVKDGHHPFNS